MAPKITPHEGNRRAETEMMREEVAPLSSRLEMTETLIPGLVTHRQAAMVEAARRKMAEMKNTGRIQAPLFDVGLSRKLNHSLILKVARDAILSLASERTHRNASSLTSNMTLFLAFDINNGHLVEVAHAHDGPLKPKDGLVIAPITAHLQPEANRISVDSKTRNDLYRFLQRWGISSPLRETIEGVLELHGQDIVDRRPEFPLTGLPGSGHSASRLPSVSEEQLTEMRKKLISYRKIPDFMSPLKRAINFYDIFLNVITLGPKGNIISTGIHIPPIAESVDVQAVIDRSGNILDYRIPDTLNGHQEAVLDAYFRSKTNTAARERWRDKNKYAVELATNTGIGPAILNAIEAITNYSRGQTRSDGSYRLQIKVIEFDGHPTFLRDDGRPVGPSDSRIEVDYGPPDPAKPGNSMLRTHVEYFVREGRLNPEAEEVFDYLKDAVGKSDYWGRDIR